MSRLRCPAGYVNPRLLIPVLVAVLAAPAGWFLPSITMAADASVQASTASGPGCGGSTAGGTSVCVIQNCISGSCEAGSEVQPATKPNTAIQLGASVHPDGTYYVGDQIALSVSPDSGKVFTEGSAILNLICDKVYPGQGEDGSDRIDPNVALPPFTYSFPIDEGTYTWSWNVDGKEKGSAPTLILDTSDMDIGSHTIECTISADIVPYSKDSVSLSCGITSPSTSLTLLVDLANPFSLVALDKNNNEPEEAFTLPATTSGKAMLKIVGGGTLSSPLDISIEAGTGNASVSPATASSDGAILTVTGTSEGDCTLIAKQGEETVASLAITITKAPSFMAGVFSIGGVEGGYPEGAMVEVGASGSGSSTMSTSSTGAGTIQLTSTNGSPSTPGIMPVAVTRNDLLVLHARTHESWWRAVFGFSWSVSWSEGIADAGLIEKNDQQYRKGSITYTETGSETATATVTSHFLFIPTKTFEYTWNVTVVDTQVAFNLSEVVVGLGPNRTSETPAYPASSSNPYPYRLTARITPKADAAIIDFKSSNTSSITVTRGEETEDGDSKIVTLVVEGVTPSTSASGDATVQATYNGATIESVPAVVLVPSTRTNTKGPYSLENYAEVKEDLDGATYTKIGSMVACTVTIHVKDQFGNSLSGIYNGEDVVREAFSNTVLVGDMDFPSDGLIKMPDNIFVNGEKADLVHYKRFDTTTPYEWGSARINSWINKEETRIRLKVNGPEFSATHIFSLLMQAAIDSTYILPSGTSTITVTVDGHSVSPGLTRRFHVLNDEYPPAPMTLTDDSQ